MLHTHTYTHAHTNYDFKLIIIPDIQQSIVPSVSHRVHYNRHVCVEFTEQSSPICDPTGTMGHLHPAAVWMLEEALYLDGKHDEVFLKWCTAQLSTSLTEIQQQTSLLLCFDL